MTVHEARSSLIVASLCLAGAAFIFFMVAPVLGYPLRFSQAMTLLQIVLPVLLGYLGAASQFVFQKNAPSPQDQPAPPHTALLIRGPIALFVVITVVAIAAFGYSNRVSAAPEEGMSVDQLSNALTLSMGLLAVTSNAAIAYFFAVEKKAAARRTPAKT